MTSRTLQGRLLLRPSHRLNSVVLGVLARAARLYDMGVCAFVVLSNHYHLSVRPRDASQLAALMSHFNGNLAKEAGRLHRWRQKSWRRRYRAIPISFEPEARIERRKYLLEQGCKENLVAKPQPIRGGLAIGELARELGVRELLLPAASAGEAATLPDLPVVGLAGLAEAIEHLAGGRPLPLARPLAADPTAGAAPDLAGVRGQGAARRALEIAAAGGAQPAEVRPARPG